MKAEQMLEIARMRLQGMSLDEIALELGCTHQEVVKGMRKMRWTTAATTAESPYSVATMRTNCA